MAGLWADEARDEVAAAGFAACPAALCVIDEDGLILAANGACAALLGRTQHALAGSAMHDMVAEAERAGVRERHRAVIAGGAPAADPAGGVLVTFLREEGGETPLRAQDAPLTLSDGTRACVITLAPAGNGPDANHDANLAAALAAAASARVAKARFLAAMNHELRTPIGAVIGFTEILLRARDPALPLQAQEYLHDVNAAGRHLLEMVDEVLDYARLEAGGYVARRARVSVRAAVGEVLRVLRARLAYGAIRTVLNGPGASTGASTGASPGASSADEDLVLMVDPRALRQCLLHLVANVEQHGRRRDGPLGADGGGLMQIAWGIEEGEPYLEVLDDGPGIAPDLLARLPEPFAQAADTYARGQEGAGLGLSIVKRLVEAHGGRFGIESALGRGTACRLTFPASAIV